MPISAETVNKLRAFTAHVCCPACGGRQHPIESLTSCGHYLCADCLTKFVLKSDNKCQKCFAYNYTNDCKEDLFVNSLQKIAIKLDKSLDKHLSLQTKTKVVPKPPEAKADNPKPKEKKVDNNKALVIESLKSCIEEHKQKSRPVPLPVTKVVKKKPLVANKVAKPSTISKAMDKSYELLDIDIDLDSIPDSLEDTTNMFTQNKSQTNGSNDNNEVISVILGGLESNINSGRISLDMGSSFNSDVNSAKEKSSQRLVMESKSCQMSQKLADKGVQTSAKVEPISVSIQCGVTQNSQCIQTSQSSAVKASSEGQKTEPSARCQSKDCFHGFVNSLSCQSLKTFVISLMEGNGSLAPVLRPEAAGSEVPKETANIVANSGEPLICSEGSSIPQTISLTDTPKAETNEPIVAVIVSPNERNVETIQSSTVKRKPSIGPKSRVKKQKVKETAEELSVGQTVESTEEKIEISETLGKKTTKRESKRNSIENKTQVNKKLNKSEATTSNVGESSGQRKGLDEKAFEKAFESVFDCSPDEEEVTNTKSKPNKRKAVPKRVTKVMKTIAESKAEGKATKPAANEYVSSEDEEKVASIERPKRKKLLPKRLAEDMEAKVKKQKSKSEAKDSVATDEPEDEDEVKTKEKTDIRSSGQKKANKSSDQKIEYISSEDEVPKEKTGSKRSTRRKPNDERSVSTEEVAKRSNTPKPRPRKNPSMPSKEAKKDVFKRPASPSVSEISSFTSSTSSRHRTSSAERPNTKFFILSSGLNEAQNKRIASLCRELNAEAVEDWSDKVTHLVIALAADRPKKERICPRNAKYLKALLTNKWIVSFEWITDSSRSNRFVDETAYEVSADRTSDERDLPKKSRTTGQKLFEKQMFRFQGVFPLLEELKEFVAIGGGVVVNTNDAFEKNKGKHDSNKLIVVSESIGLPNTQKDGIKYLSKSALIAAISNFQTV